MTRTPGKLLVAFCEQAAAAALATPAMAQVAGTVTPAQFAAANRPVLLTMIARLPDLKANLRKTFGDELAAAPELLRQLTGDDARAAVAAAETLAQPDALVPRAPVRSPAPAPAAAGAAAASPAATAEPAGSAAAKRASRVAQQLSATRARLAQLRGQLDYHLAERDAARRDRDAALSDRDDALATVDGLRAELAVARRRSEDLEHAVALLAVSLTPADPIEPADVDDGDPRTAELAAAQAVADAAVGTGTPPAAAGIDIDADTGTELPPRNPAVAAALKLTGLTRGAVVGFLDAVLHPPTPEPDQQAETAETGPSVAYTQTRRLRLTPLGGGTDIGGSCMLIEAGDVRILVDAGTRPKRRMDDAAPPEIHRALSDRLDAIVITHAHTDHAGYVPAVIAAQPHLPVFCTADTAALLPTMWADSLRVFERHLQTPGYGDTRPVPPYTGADTAAAAAQLRPVAHGRTLTVGDSVTIELFPAGHILGAAGVVVSAGADRITVTGDVSDLAQATVPGLTVPDSAVGSGLLAIESTYCREGGSPREAEVEAFVSTVAETIAGGGRVLVPAFALGRAQEVVLTLRRRLPDVPVLVDGMAKEISRIYEQQTAGTDRPLTIFGGLVREVRPGRGRREAIASFSRGVVVTTSGMLTAGPAVEWARSILPDPSAALLISGYQDEESPGAALLRLSDGGQDFDLDGVPTTVTARVAKFGLSAHANRDGLTSIIDTVAADQVMLVHGLRSAQQEFAAHLNRRGTATAPTRYWQA